MRVLMIAPEPFFQPRGTPFSEFYRIRCLSELGHEVDLVTYPMGEDVSVPGLRIIRARNFNGIKEVPIGPSFVKIPLDTLLFAKAWRLAAAGCYDLIHTHEEAGILGHFLSRYYGLPHVYDMHSSLPQQLVNFQFTHSRIVLSFFNWMERVVVESADAIIAICPSLVEKVREIKPNANVTLIENTAESHEVDTVAERRLEQLRSRLDLGGKRIILYIGTFEPYQGLGMLLRAIDVLTRMRDDFILLFVGGQKDQVEALRQEAEELHLAERCRFTGQVAHEEVPAYLRLADVLVSPRIIGTNTPLKIYSYLRARAPIVATDLPTHTQVLGNEVAMLAAPEPEAFAGAIAHLLDDGDLAERLWSHALRLSEERYSYKQYVEKTRLLYEEIQKLVNG